MNDTDLQSSFEIQSVIFGIVAIGIFILTGTGTVMLSTRRKCKNIILIVGPHDLHVSPSIPIYHSAPGSENVPQIYDTANSGYLEVVHDGLQQATSFESDEDIKIENENLNVINVYEEID
ncbi:uncharacterized protein LOC143058354 [Mytilus galloprovincialis]|uniref:uncharacterized protein LOC143058354 n=1 Tax=Mytilus galloprovincialis TaxID=29158 RepID=UPI003F7B9F91